MTDRTWQDERVADARAELAAELALDADTLPGDVEIAAARGHRAPVTAWALSRNGPAPDVPGSRAEPDSLRRPS